MRMNATRTLRVAVLLAAFLARQAIAADFTLELVPGWNLVSVPIAPDDPSPGAVFQGRIQGTVWEYAPDQGCYAEAAEIQPGQGYWVYVPVRPDRAEEPLPPLTVAGSAVRSSTVSLGAGWNLLGPVSYEPYAALPIPLTVESGARDCTGPVWIWRDLRYHATDSLPCGAGAWVRSTADCTVRVSPNPTFAGALMAYSPEVGEACAHWPEAIDDRTVAGDMLYRVYAAPAGREGLIDDANLVETVVGTTQADLTGLTPGGTYSIAVLAEDEAGNRNYFNRTVLSVPVMQVANVLAKTPRDIAAEGIEVSGVSLDGAVVTVAGAGGLAVGDLIVLDNPNGQGLKRIVAVDPTREGVELTTVDACLAEVIDTGVLRSSLVVSDMDGLVPTGATRDGGVAYQDPAGAFRLTGQAGDGQGASRDEVGVIGGRYEGEANLGSGLSVGYGIGFKPAIDTEARFEFLSLKYCRIVATGEFSLDAWAKYELAGELSANPTRKLFGVSHTFHYQVGYLPVWQDVGLDFHAEMDVTAAGALDMEAVYSAAKTVQIGVEYDDGAWRTITSDGFAQSVTFDVQAEGTLLATVKIYPVLWTKFYSSLAASLYVEPTLQLDSQVRLLPLPVETTKFDVDFLVNSRVEAGIEIFDWGKTWTSPDWTMLDIPILSLPEIGFASPPDTAGTNQPTVFALDLIDGKNNPVPPGNIEWWVESVLDGDRALPTIVPSADRRSATVTAAEPGEYRLWASAYGSGFLGRLGKRYVSTTFVVGTRTAVIRLNMAGGEEYDTISLTFDSATGGTAVVRMYTVGNPTPYHTETVPFTLSGLSGSIAAPDSIVGRTLTTVEDGESELTVFGSTTFTTLDPVHGDETGTYTYTKTETTTAMKSGKNLTDAYECPNLTAVGRCFCSGESGYSQGGTTAVGTARAGSYPGTMTDPEGAAGGSGRTYRGGGWGSFAWPCRSADRGKFSPSTWYHKLGLRLVMTVP